MLYLPKCGKCFETDNQGKQEKINNKKINLHRDLCGSLMVLVIVTINYYKKKILEIQVFRDVL